jgi:hypothetical protein
MERARMRRFQEPSGVLVDGRTIGAGYKHTTVSDASTPALAPPRT